MASPPTIPVDSLLVPLADDAPAGQNLRLDSAAGAAYYALKDKRGSARAAERRAEIDAPGSHFPAEWQQVLALAQDILTSRSKDLEAAAWLTEALARVHGFAGLRDGLALVRGLLEGYWETFFSLEDEEGLATRLAPIAGLNGVGTEGTLIQPIRRIAVATSPVGHAYGIYQYDDARALASIADPDVRARKEAAADVTLDGFMAAVEASGGAFYVSLLSDIDESLAALAALNSVLQERAGRDAPSLMDIRTALNGVRDTISHFSADVVARMRPNSDGGLGPKPIGGGVTPIVKNGQVGTREEALRTLLQVADYFRQNEPHSPIATSLEELVRRARLPFSELLAELVSDPTVWRAALTSAGIKPPPETG